MWFAVLLVVVLLVGVVAAATMSRGRRSPYRTVEDRPPGRD